MRHRKVLNLYDTDPGHEDLLVYLEGIEGSHRQQQALLQMAMVGFRVIAFHESGDEAYYGIRNPDARAAKKISAPRLSAKPRRESPVIEATAEKIEKVEKAEKHPVVEPAQEKQAVEMEVPDVRPPLQAYPEQTSQEDEYNTLEILRMMDEGED